MRREKKLLSIIIPVFNKEKYILETLKSISQLCIDDYEVICVDDGSTDNSLSLLSTQSIIKKEKIKVLQINNSGPGYAKNYGIRNCVGEYVMFCDADDCIVASVIEKMYRIICDFNVDVVVSDYKEVFDSQKENILQYKFTSDNDYFELVRRNVAAVAKIFNIEFLLSNEVSFSNTYQGEDRVFLGRVIAGRPTIMWVNDIGYVYHRHELDVIPTLTHQYTYDSYRERLENWRLFFESCRSVSEEETRKSIEIGFNYIFKCWLMLDIHEKNKALVDTIDFCHYVFGKDDDSVSIFGIAESDFKRAENCSQFASYYVKNMLRNHKRGNNEDTQVIDEPVVSIIIPFYNVSKYLDECIVSLLNQSMGNFEIILVDDASSDCSYGLAELYQMADKRIRLLRNTETKGAGYSRNRGMAIARGKYILFLDADDFFESNMLSDTVSISEKENLDVLVFNGSIYYEDGKRFERVDYILKEALVPDLRPFSGADTKYIFNMTTGAPWNKLIRRKHIESNDIHFMTLPNSNDTYFCYMALALAKRIDVLFDRYVNYRQSSNSIQATKDDNPLCWYEALNELREGLTRHGIFESVFVSYVNYAVSFSIYNLNSLKKRGSFCSVYSLIHSGGMERIGIDNHSLELVYSFNERNRLEYDKIQKLSEEEYLFDQLCSTKKICNEKQIGIEMEKKISKEERRLHKHYQGEYERVCNSLTYKVGNVITILPRKLRKTIRRWRFHG